MPAGMIWESNAALSTGISSKGNLAFIPASFDLSLTEPLEQHYMNALFNLGYDPARKGFPWAKLPPGC
jgi:hypothetical protein